MSSICMPDFWCVHQVVAWTDNGEKNSQEEREADRCTEGGPEGIGLELERSVCETRFCVTIITEDSNGLDIRVIH